MSPLRTSCRFFVFFFTYARSTCCTVLNEWQPHVVPLRRKLKSIRMLEREFGPVIGNCTHRKFVTKRRLAALSGNSRRIFCVHGKPIANLAINIPVGEHNALHAADCWGSPHNLRDGWQDSKMKLFEQNSTAASFCNFETCLRDMCDD